MPFILQDGKLVEVTDAQFAAFGGGEAGVRTTTAEERRAKAAAEAAAGGQNIQTTGSNSANNQQIINPNTTNNTPGQTLSKVPAPLRESDIPPGDEDLYEYNLEGQLVKASVRPTDTVTSVPPIPGVEPASSGWARAANEVKVTPEELNAAGITNVPAGTPMRPSSSNTTTSQETITGGTVTTTTVTPTTYKDNDQSRALQSEADALAAKQEERRAALRAEGKTGAEILRDPEMRQLSQEKQAKELAAQNAKSVDQAGTATTTTSPGSGTVNEQTVDGQYLTTKTSGDDPTAAAGAENQYVASGGPVEATEPGAIPAGEDPYVDDTTGLTEFTEGDEVRWEDPTDAGLLPTEVPYEDTEGTEAFDNNFGAGVDSAPDPYEVDGAGIGLTEEEQQFQDNPQQFGVDPYEVDGAGIGLTEEEIQFQDNPRSPDVDPYEVDNNDRALNDDEIAAQDNPPGQTAAQQANLANARAQATLQAQRKQANDGDWRVKLRLAPGADYLYRASNGQGSEAGILQPLAETDGVIFPYTPIISTSYKANYSNYDLTHSNYRGYFYQGSHVDEITIQAVFTAQDSTEANYLLAVMHFFKSVTKMFYGKDANAGTPPPLVFLQGLGQYQFNLHPCLVSSFNYSLPNDVDYIRAGSPNIDGTNLLQRRRRDPVVTNPFFSAWKRLEQIGATKGGIKTPPPPPTLGTNSPTYVPTKMDMTITLLPTQTREQVSKQFSLKQFANGQLVKGGFW